MEVGPGDGNLVTELGILTVTGRTGIEGAEVRGEAVEAGAPVCGVDELSYPGIEVGEQVQAAFSYCGVERQRSVPRLATFFSPIKADLPLTSIRNRNTKIQS